MRQSRRYFLRRTAELLSVLVGGVQVAGCLGGGSGSGSGDAGSPPPPAPASAAAGSAPPPADVQPLTPAPSVAAQPASNGAPVWQASPTIEFVEGVPATVSIRQFVQDPNQDPLIIQLNSGTFVPGVTWNPSNSTIGYDGRPLGAQPQQPVVISGITFSADDGKQ